MIGLVLRRSRLAEQSVAADRAYISAVRAEYAGVPEKSDVCAVGRKDVPTVDKREILTLRAEKMLRVHGTEA